MECWEIEEDIRDDIIKDEIDVSKLNEYLEHMESRRSILQKTTATIFFRKLFTGVDNIKDLEHERIIGALLKVLGDNEGRIRSTNKELVRIRKNCAWALTNIACISKEQCHSLVNQNGVEIIFKVAAEMAPKGSELKMQCIWALANIAADCDQCKERCRQTEVIQMLTSCLEDYEFYNERDVQNIIWCMHNVMKRGMAISHNLAVSSSRMVFEIMMQYSNSPKQVVVECLWTLASIADDPNFGAQIDAVLHCPDIISEVLKIFMKGDEKIKHGCLRLLGNIVTGNDAQTAAVVFQQNFYAAIKDALSLTYALSHEAIWICSNVAASDPSHIEQLFLEDHIIKKIIYFANHGDNKLRKEAHWTLVNLLRGSSPHRLHKLISIGIVLSFPAILVSDDVRVVERGLSSLRDILRDYPNWSHFCQTEGILNKVRANLRENESIQTQIFEVQVVLNRNHQEVQEPYTFRFTK